MLNNGHLVTMTPKTQTGFTDHLQEGHGQSPAGRTATPDAGFRVIQAPTWYDYALLDSGGGRKLERFGSIIIDRPEPQALWDRQRPVVAWGGAHAVFSASGADEEKGRWRIDKPVPDAWPVALGQVRLTCRLQGLWHVGVFPEQRPHWDWMRRQLSRIEGRPPRVLNLFGYTGAASLLAAADGAEVTHVDASRKAIQWARENQSASGLDDAPIRWILDDAAKFVGREVRRGRSYDVILVDPPKFGRGPKNETWDLFADLPALLRDCAKLVPEEGPAAVILTVYAIRASAVAFAQLTQQVFEAPNAAAGRLDDLPEFGELVLTPQHGGFGVPTSLFVRWSR